MRTSVADDVRRGQALRARRQRWLAGGLAAAVVVGLGAGLGAPRLVGGTDPQPAPAATAGVADAVQQSVERSEKALRDLGYEPTLAALVTHAGDRARWAFTFPSPPGYVPARLTVVLYPQAPDAVRCDSASCGPTTTSEGPDASTSYVQRTGDAKGTLTLRRDYRDGGAIALTAAPAAPLPGTVASDLDSLSAYYQFSAELLPQVADAIGNPSGLQAEPTPAPTGSADPIDVRRGPSLLVGYWTVAGTGTGDDGATLQLGAMDAGSWTLWRECGGIDGLWRASTAGGFVAGAFSGDSDCFPADTSWRPTPEWLEPVRGYRLTETGAELLDASGAVLARLTPGERPDHGPHRSEVTTELPELTPDVLAELDGVRVPDGATPASIDAVAGRWVPVGATNKRAFLGLKANGWYEGSDGCNSTDVSGALTRSVALELDGDTLVAVDADGTTVMTFTRA